MSRSRKKNPVVKDKGWLGKRTHNRRFRSVNKQRINMGLDPLHKYEVTNPWDICDWKYSLFGGYKVNKWWKPTREEYNEYVKKIKRK